SARASAKYRTARGGSSAPRGTRRRLPEPPEVVGNRDEARRSLRHPSGAGGRGRRRLRRTSGVLPLARGTLRQAFGILPNAWRSLLERVGGMPNVPLAGAV